MLAVGSAPGVKTPALGLYVTVKILSGVLLGSDLLRN
jgi:hypothetical protein